MALDDSGVVCVQLKHLSLHRSVKGPVIGGPGAVGRQTGIPAAKK